MSVTQSYDRADSKILRELLVRSELTQPWYRRHEQERQLNRRRYLRKKRLMDLVIGTALLPIVLPILFLCIAAIKLDSSGPVFFAQNRTGKGGRRFRMLKLRTMVENAEELKAQCQALNELKAPDFKIANDPRITRVGRILRKTSLDELPQIFNVMRGDMSLVGPRPTSFSSSTYSPWHTARLEVKSGITGLWQVSGRNDLEFDERVRLDIAYGKSQSLWFDIKLILLTVGCVFSGRGAN
jgi:lipopolysaccharide/colanic/teichoic acid biosynthesis glycosyltransferase